jgi:hypothetical protein
MSKRKPSAKLTTPAVVARVQRAVAVKNGGKIPKGSFVGRMQRAAAKLRSTGSNKTKKSSPNKEKSHVQQER